LISGSGASHRWIYLCVFITGTSRAFLQPAKAALLPLMVPVRLFSNAVAWNSGGFHLAAAVGPALGGSLIALSRPYVFIYLLTAGSALSFFFCLLLVHLKEVARERHAVTLRDLVAGLSFLSRNQVVLGALLLDMFAVLLGGALALLPVYAKDILRVGSGEFGIMRASPAIGALLMSVILAHRRPFSQAGRTLLWSVAGFGLATIIFGLSRNYYLSVAMLFLTGVLDTISVVIRHTLVQVLTPDHLRGRVSAINGLFIGASNELGAFESGTVARLFTPTISVVSGGIGTLLVVITAAIRLPRLRRYGALGSPPPEDESDFVPPENISDFA
jgi:MFS family permease